AGSQFCCSSLKHGLASALDFVASAGQAGEKVAHLLLDCGTGPQAQVGGHLLTYPAPNSLVGVEIWAIGGQVHQAQVQVGVGQVGSQRVAPMSWGIVPNHRQRFGVLRPQLTQEGNRQEGNRGGGVAVTFQFHQLHLSGFQTHRRVVARLLPTSRAGGVHQRRFTLQHPFGPQIRIRPKVSLVSEEYLGPSSSGRRRQGDVLPHKAFPPYRVCLDQPLLGTLQDKAQPVQVIQATTPAQRQPEAFLYQPAHRLPVPVGQIDASLRRQFLHRRLQLGLPLPVQCGG
ncbi:hypothetical protein GBAR_LOCUS11576, partial [Geodia barretti]